MKCVWCDTETTGLKPENAAPFQIAMIYTNIRIEGEKKSRCIAERCFYLNPLNDVIKYDEEAGKIHGFSEERIRALYPPKEIIAIIADFLELCKKDFSDDPELDKSLPFFIGYNVSFDFEHMCKLFSDYGFDFKSYFQPRIIDVYKQVKNAAALHVLPRLENLKQTTVAAALNVELNNAHDAMADIKATRNIATILQKSGVNLF